ncbi:hypothetical protein K440DRAFT_658577 [Wilcoxina mikolae CBS 423.85]|nr:hypothetical protein K440DRAFT_658577 [Wilcoxina mikolae CBS 423.85]
MPPANSPSDTPSLAPHRRSVPLPGAAEFDVTRNLPPARHTPSLFDADSWGARSGGVSLLHRSHRTYDHGINLDARPRRAGASRRNSRDQDLRQSRDQAYGPRIPLVRPGQRQSVYDWAPAPGAPVGGNYDPESRTLPPLFNYGTLDEDLSMDLPYQVRDSLLEAREIRETRELRLSNRYAELGAAPGSGSGDSTFRMAVMQSLRNNNPRRPSYPRAHWQDITSLERERMDEAIRPRLGGRASDTITRARLFRPSRSDHGSDLFLPAASKEVEKAIDYLSKVRMCRTPEESLRLAIRAGVHKGDDWLELCEEQIRCEDFVLNTSFMRTAETSWLKAGGVFWGSQIAPTLSAVSPRSAHSSTSSTSPVHSSISHNLPSIDGEGSSTRGSLISSASQWTVKVSISSIDYSQLRLTGTMEAFTDRKTNSASSSIITYLEGEIIDFNKHSFETLNFSSSLSDDANNWRKLEPFVHMSNTELVKNLVSRSFMKELTENWVFMRWKEKCFISPDPDVGGLTIGGFYFLSLKREDGRIQGYYYDPQSQPYQELTLKPQKPVFPTYEFR